MAVLLAVALLSRLPQLTSPHLVLDGDEAILGLMAKHMAEGRGFPVFFYGQTYGLSLVEAGAGAVAFLIGGVGDVPLKLAMLALWSSGVVCWYLGLTRLVGRAWSFWTAVLLILLPAWAVWSMKARGGYLTAFAATGYLVYLLVRQRERGSDARWALAGALTAVILLAQRLWLPGLLPLLAASLWAGRRLRPTVAWLGGIATTLLAASAASGLTLTQLVVGPPRGRNPDPIGSWADTLARVYTNFTGSYYLWVAIPPGPVTALLAWLMCGLLAFLLVLQLYRLTSGRYLPLSHLLALSVVGSLAATWVLVIAAEPRFFLPVPALLLAWAAVEAADLTPRLRVPPWVGAAVVGSCIALSALSQVEFREFTYLWDGPTDPGDESEWIEAVIARVERAGIRHVFVGNGLLQWQLMFYSHERLVARYMGERDRFPAYVSEVDWALEGGAPVALVGYARARGELERAVDASAITTIGRRYFVYERPDQDLLRALGFRFMADRRR